MLPSVAAVLLSHRIAGGGGGGGAVTVTSQAGGGSNTGTITASASPTPSGPNPAVFAGGATGGASVDDMKYGGSGGTDIAQIGTEQTGFFGTATLASFGASGSPTSATDAYVLFTATALAGMSQLYLNNVSQADPFDDANIQNGTGDAFSGTSIVATLSWTGLSAGKFVVANFGFYSFSDDAISSVASGNGGTTTLGTLRLSPDESNQYGIVQAYGTADGSGNLTLAVTATLAGDGGENCWVAQGVPVNAA